MKQLIVYGSQYGTTKRYAEKLSELTGIPAIPYEDIQDLTPYDQIIHFGGLYAGGVKGLKNTVKAMRGDAKLIIVTVGLADVRDKENTESIRNSIRKQVPKALFDDAILFHLRGGIDYKRLSFKHRAMMTLLYNKVKNLPEDQKTAEARAMIETFNTKVDFYDDRALMPIVEAAK
jgi:menaquinone-dependent protoporphyrinogen IX oxidase